ncbi:MAG: VanZ family protein [Desulfobacterales bacterium]|nr:MAG: VanZ family protein [Desulfobacterales bacterium]
MFDAPPREKPWVSWFYVIIWTLVIFATIPLARGLQDYVSRQWGSAAFTYTVLGAVGAAFATAVVHLRGKPATPGRSYLWLLAVAAVFGGYTLKLGVEIPEEAIHFIQYGLLGILVYRALTHRLRDMGIYLAAAMICGIIGTLDEVVQWLIPGRYWGLNDIWINFLAAALVQIAIAEGLKPKIIGGRPNRANLRFLLRLAIAAGLLFGTSLLNTPARIAWYTARIPGLMFLAEHESVMLEYGYRYHDPDIGIFRSRIAPAALKQTDAERAQEAATILDRFQEGATYPAFLKLYTPVNDPFVHEARVHLYRRDVHFEQASQYEHDPPRYAAHLSVAFRENRIMEKYFPNTLAHSAYVWSADQRALSGKHLLQEEEYDSAVSQTLVTQVTERQVAYLFIILLGGLTGWHGYLGKHPVSRPSS